MLDADADVNLDPVEAVVGDIDVDVDAAAELLPEDGGLADADVTVDAELEVLDEVAEAVDGLLGAGADESNDPADEDLTVDGDVDVAGVDVLDADADVNLDPVEAIVGDIDIDIDADADLLAEGGDAMDGDVQDALSMIAEDGGADTEEPSNDLGELSFDEADAADPDSEMTIDSDDGDILPDPSGSVLEGLNGVICDDGSAGLEGSFLG